MFVYRASDLLYKEVQDGCYRSLTISTQNMDPSEHQKKWGHRALAQKKTILLAMYFLDLTNQSLSVCLQGNSSVVKQFSTTTIVTDKLIRHVRWMFCSVRITLWAMAVAAVRWTIFEVSDPVAGLPVTVGSAGEAIRTRLTGAWGPSFCWLNLQTPVPSSI
jgi:hypothetical protein